MPREPKGSQGLLLEEPLPENFQQYLDEPRESSITELPGHFEQYLQEEPVQDATFTAPLTNAERKAAMADQRISTTDMQNPAVVRAKLKGELESGTDDRQMRIAPPSESVNIPTEVLENAPSQVRRGADINSLLQLAQGGQPTEGTTEQQQQLLKKIPMTMSLGGRTVQKTQGADEEVLDLQQEKVEQAAEARKAAANQIMKLAAQEKGRQAKVEQEMARRQEEAEALLARKESFQKELEQDFVYTQLNPYQYVDNMSTANKVFSIIAAAIGQGLEYWTRGEIPNRVPQALQQAIDRDIAIQKANIDLMANKVQMGRQEVKQLRDVAEKWFNRKREAALSAYKHALSSLSAKADSADAQLRYAQAAVSVEQARPKTMVTQTSRSVINPLAAQLAGGLLAGDEKNLLKSERLKRVENTATLVSRIDQSLNRLAKFRDKRFGTLGDYFSRSEASRMAITEAMQLLASIVRAGGDVGNIGQKEQDRILAAVQSPGSLETFIRGRKMSWLLGNLESIAKRYSQQFMRHMRTYQGEGFYVSPHAREALNFMPKYLGAKGSKKRPPKGAEKISKD